MSNQDDPQRCPECGSALDDRHSGLTGGLYCVRCDWAVVTTIKAAFAPFEMRIWQIRGIDLHDKAQLLAVAKLLGVGALEVRRRVAADRAIEWLADEIRANAARNFLAMIDRAISITPAELSGARTGPQSALD